jgi:Cu/Ag efflux protein CusF
VDLLKSNRGNLLMFNSGRSVLILVAACAIPFLSACQPAPAPQPTPAPQPAGSTPVTQTTPQTTCDCSTFPPREGCDSQCGITTGVIESVTADSLTISVPSITSTATGQQVPQVTQRTFKISPSESQQLQSFKRGSRVALTFHQQSGQNVMKSIRPIPPEQPK